MCCASCCETVRLPRLLEHKDGGRGGLEPPGDFGSQKMEGGGGAGTPRGLRALKDEGGAGFRNPPLHVDR